MSKEEFVEMICERQSIQKPARKFEEPNSLPMHDASKKRKRKETRKEDFVEMICEHQSIQKPVSNFEELNSNQYNWL